MIKSFLFKSLFVLFCIHLTSCVDNYEYELTDFRQKSYQEVKRVGSYCSENCIWSKYAVDLNIQEKTANCVEGSCACVEDGNAYNLCDVSSITSQTIEPQNSHSIENKDIPYYNQYDNVNYGWATCQNTSIAMILSYYERIIHPDTIFAKWGKDIAQSPSGLNRVYRDYSTKSSIRTYTDASPEQLRDFLSRGFTAIVHGYFTQYGHVIVVKSFDGQYYYVNDPAGEWKGCFKCGYDRSYNGVTRYSKQAFENAVFSSDGYSYLPGWIHVIN